MVTTENGHTGVVVVNASTGALERVLESSACGFTSPAYIAARGDVAFVADEGGSITQLRQGECQLMSFGSSYELTEPDLALLSGGRLLVASGWPTSANAGGMTEIDEATGSFVRVIAGSSTLPYTVLAAGGGRLYVADWLGTVMQIDIATGAIVRKFSLPFGTFVEGAALSGSTLYLSVGSGQLAALDTQTGVLRQLASGYSSGGSSVTFYWSSPSQSVVVAGADVFYLSVGQDGTASITEADRATLKVLRRLPAPDGQVSSSSQMALLGDRLFVTDPGITIRKQQIILSPRGALMVYDTTTGHLVRDIAGPRYDFSSPTDIAIAGNDVFVSDSLADAVTEVNATTGRLVTVMKGAPYYFDGPGTLVADNTHLFVVNTGGDSVTDVALGP